MKRRLLLMPLLALAAAAPALACIALPPRDPQKPVSDIHLPEQRAFLYQQDGNEHLILSVRYQGAPSQFAWVIPTEGRPRVDVQKGAPFHELWRLTELALPVTESRTMGAAAPGAAAPPPVTVLERKEAGPYDIAVLQATSGGGLYDWLNRNGFQVSLTARQALDGYVQRNWYFAAARIRPSGQANQQIQANLTQGNIAALHLTFRAHALSYPLRVTTGNPGASSMQLFVVGQDVQGPPLLQHLQFTLKPQGQSGFAVQGPPGLLNSQGDFPTLRSLLPQGGTLHKYTGVLTAEQRSQDLVFSPIPTASR